MPTTLKIGDAFPDVTLPNHNGEPSRLSDFTAPGAFDRMVGFGDGYPLVVVFYRGFFCPRDQRQMQQLVQMQGEFDINFARLVCIGTDAPIVHAAFRAGVGARWPFLSDEKRTVIKQIGILDETEGEYAYPAQPYTFVLNPDLSVYSIYNGWFFVGRPTPEELKKDLRSVMEALGHYGYDAHNAPEVRQVRIAQQEWRDGAPPLGANGLPIAAGMVRSFNLKTGNGIIETIGADGKEVFFNFTAIPGEGYRTISAGTSVEFELVEGLYGLTARNVQRVAEKGLTTPSKPKV